MERAASDLASVGEGLKRTTQDWFMLAQKYADRIANAFAKYPDKRSAVMPLLYIAQEEYGWVSPEGITEVAQLCDMDPTQVKSIAGFYTMYSETPKGKY